MSILDIFTSLASESNPEAKPPLDELIARPGVAPSPWQIAAAPPLHPTTARARAPVAETSDLERILALPERPPSPPLMNLERVNIYFSLPPRACKCAEGRCITALKPVQAWALYEMAKHGGLLAPIGVGQGKTGLDILGALAIPGVRTAVLLVPPSLVEQLRHDYLAWREHFRVPSMVFQTGHDGWIVPGAPTVHVLPYSRLSRPEATEILERLKPDLIIADEAHRLRHRNTATTSRVIRFLDNHPETRFCAWSGSLTDKSIKDYAHLAAFALRDGSPLPLDPHVVEEWSLAIDPSDWPKPAGELFRLCRAGETLYQGFRRRLLYTPGVVTTASTVNEVNASLYLVERKPGKIPHEVQAALEDLRHTWTRPDGEELVDALSMHATARQLASGFYYRWIFPKKEPRDLILEWFEARKAWHKEVREKLKSREPHLDSPLLCTKAAIRYWEDIKSDLPRWKSDTWRRWRDVRGRVQPETDAVWLSDYLAADAAAWARKHRGIVWYDQRAFGERVSTLSGLPLHGGGPDATERIRAETGKTSIVASIASHGTGRDGLQYLFAEQLVANPPTAGAAWEQLLGRLHRIGQEADEINTYVYRHTPELADAVDTATDRGTYVQETLGTAQKLLSASRDWNG